MPALSASDEHRRRRRALLAVGLLALAAAGLRVPFMWTGIGADEGGYAFIAHEWAHGAHLYRDLFVDRPQGLMLLYRALTDVAYQAWAIRLGAVICGALLTLIMAALGAMLGTRVTALCAATIFAVAGVAPRIEGFTMEGELAAAVPAAAAVACAVRWRGGDGDTGRPVRGDRWLAAAGAFGAVAMLMKQSGFDGLAVAVLVAVAAAGPLRTRARRGGLVVCGALIPFAAAAVHGISLGWRDYWFGIYGWRAQQDLGRSLGGRISELVHALPQIAPDVWGMALVAAAGVVVCLSRRRALWIAPVWLGVCVVALNAGGLYLPHYFIQLLAPLALLAALGASAVYARTRPLGIGLVLLSVAAVTATLADYATTSPQQRDRAIAWEGRYEDDVRVARFIDAHSTRADGLFAFPSRADLYFLADRFPATPYLWEHTPLVRASTAAAIRARLASPARPKFVVVIEGARDTDPSGRLPRVIDRDYRTVWRPPGVHHMRVMLVRGAAL